MKKYILLLSAIVSIGLTTYFSLLPLNWVSQADISNLYTTPITPAGFTFSIWSIIYLSWLALGIYAVVKKPKISKSLRYKLVAAQLLSAAWLVPWHFQYILSSMVIMAWVFGFLWQAMWAKKSTDKFFRYTIWLFFGWIAVAALLNLNITLIDQDLYSNPALFSAISIAIAGFISMYWIYEKKNYMPLLVLIWALIGIFLK